jgi:hypothetical protein
MDYQRAQIAEIYDLANPRARDTDSGCYETTLNMLLSLESLHEIDPCIWVETNSTKFPQEASADRSCIPPRIFSILFRL